MDNKESHNCPNKLPPLKKRKVVNVDNGEIQSEETQVENDECSFARSKKIKSKDPDLPLDFSRKTNGRSPSSDHLEQIPTTSSHSGSPPSDNEHNQSTFWGPSARKVNSCRSFPFQGNLPSPISRSRHVINDHVNPWREVNERETYNRRESSSISPSRVYQLDDFSNTSLVHVPSIPHSPLSNFAINNHQAVQRGFYINNNAAVLSVPLICPANLNASATNLLDIPNDRRQKTIRPFKMYGNEVMSFGQQCNLQSEIPSDFPYLPINGTSPSLHYSTSRAQPLSENSPPSTHSRSPNSNTRMDQEMTGNVEDDHSNNSLEGNHQQPDSQQGNHPDSQQNIRRKGKKLPDEQKDEAYWEKRRKNNEAAKRSRDARRIKEDRVTLTATRLIYERKAMVKEIYDRTQEIVRLEHRNRTLEQRNRTLENLVASNRCDTCLRSRFRAIDDSQNDTSPVASSKIEKNPGL